MIDSYDRLIDNKSLILDDPNQNTMAQPGFILLTIIFFGWLIFELRQSLAKSAFPEARKRKIFRLTVLALSGWLILTGSIASTGFFHDFTTMPPKFLLVVIVPLVTIIWITSTKTVKELLRHIPPQNLLAMQSFRILVEVFLWMLFIDEVLPVQMTFEGRNFDIIAGITGPVMAVLYRKRLITNWMVSTWNIVGLILLINIVAIAVLSTPLPIRVFMNEPANTIVTLFPVIWLPAFLVPLAYGLHLLSLRQIKILTEKPAP